MKNITEYKVILWDFDGVIMDSMPIRGIGFQEVLKHYPREQVEKLLAFHEQNGGLSRYVKFSHFFEKIRGEEITNQQVLDLADEFSKIMMSFLIDEKLLIKDSIDFIKKNYLNYDMHIVSGSDGNELRQICEGLKIDNYFRTINGSPTHKTELVRQLIGTNNYNKKEVVLIGDSINDNEAAQVNDITFVGYNNLDLLPISRNYIISFKNIVNE